MTPPPGRRSAGDGGCDTLLSADANRRMFDRIACRYDRMNALISLGQHTRWRRRAVAALAPVPTGRYLDIGCGTADVAVEVCRQAPGATVVGIDPAEEMLAVGRGKLHSRDLASAVTLCNADATALPFDDASFDGAVTAFCIRNVTDRSAALAEMHRVLKPAGRAVVLELTLPPGRIVRAAYKLYTRLVVAPAGRIVAARADAYHYLLASIENFPPPAALAAEMASAGFAEPHIQSLSAGTVAIVSATA